MTSLFHWEATESWREWGPGINWRSRGLSRFGTKTEKQKGTDRVLNSVLLVVVGGSWGAKFCTTVPTSWYTAVETHLPLWCASESVSRTLKKCLLYSAVPMVKPHGGGFKNLPTCLSGPGQFYCRTSTAFTRMASGQIGFMSTFLSGRSICQLAYHCSF